MSSKPLAPASPLPWEYDSKELRRERTGYGVMLDANGKIIFDTINSDVAEIRHGDELGCPYWDETGRKDLLFAMRAANCHDRLLASCKELLDAYEDGIPQCSCERGGFPSPAPCLICRARDIIAEAEGSP